MAARQDDPTTEYAKDVVAGVLVAGEFVRLACKRHLDDVAWSATRGLRWCPEAARAAFGFFKLLCHSKGRWAGQEFDLQPWQKFVVGSVFGWKRADGTRRFGVAHVEVARKNGKTTLGAGIGLYLLMMDGEEGAEVYTVATKQDQATLTHAESKRMAQASAHLRREVRVQRNAISHAATNSKYEPLASDSDKLDGLNVHGAICDELHAWKQRHLWDVLETSTGARDQPLFLITTTAGVSRESIWWERRELAIRVLRGTEGATDDSLFAYVATPDEGDDWRDEKAWAKGNPNLGVTIRKEELRKRVAEAEATPGKQNAFKRLRLNMPTESANLWLNMDHWDACGLQPIDEDLLEFRPCFAGLDLSATEDMSALALLFEPQEENEPWQVLLRFWLPRDGIAEKSKRDKVDYRLWAQRGLVTLTDGNVIDYNAIERQVLSDAERFSLRTLAFDRYMANQLTLRLQDRGINVVGYGQGWASMAQPVKFVEELVAGRRLAHGGNPVLRWQATCAAVKSDEAGNRKPDKKSSTSRIDGLVAMLMAAGVAQHAAVEGECGVEVW